MQVIDGMHRLRAAVIRGESKIWVRFVDCDEKDIFVIAVQANTAHGLPLSLAERKRAAARIIGLYPHWSDRLIASASGLSHKTVGAIRGPATGENSQLQARTGHDGRVRALSSAVGRMAAANFLQANPGASLQQVANAVGISPGTARDVRDRLARGQDPVLPERVRGRAVPDGAAGAQPAALDGQAGRSRAPGAVRNASTPTTGEPAGDGRADANGSTGYTEGLAILHRLKSDPALRLSDNGRAILRQLHASTIGIGDLSEALAKAPAHSAITISKLARANARKWMELAHQLENAARRT